MATKRTNTCTCGSGCTCGCNGNEILTTTQLENSTVLNAENLENKDKILVLSTNINNAYMVKVMSTLTVNDLVKAINNPGVAFLLVEMKEPAAPVEPENPGTTTPENPGTTTPENPGTNEGENAGSEDSEGGKA